MRRKFFGLPLLLFPFLLLLGCGEGPSIDESSLIPPLGAKFPPLILREVTPFDGEEKVDRSPFLTLKFSNLVNPESLTVNSFPGRCVGTIQLSKDNFLHCEHLIKPFTEDNGYTYMVSLGNRLEESSNYKIRITEEIRDVIGKRLTNPVTYKQGFTTSDSTPPKVTSIYPGGGEEEVHQETMIQVVFNKAMNDKTITTNVGTSSCSGNVSISKDGFLSCFPMSGPPEVSEDKKNFILTPLYPLDSETLFQVAVLKNVQDVSGNELRNSVITSGFQVVDWIPPELVSTRPSNESTNVNVNTDIRILFSESMATSTITVSLGGTACNDNLQLSHDDFKNCLPMQGPPDYLGHRRNFSIRPKLNLEPGKNYKIKVTKGVTDLQGNPLSSEFILNPGFRTSEYPKVTATFPVEGSKNISYTSNLSVTFNVSMNVTTIYTNPFSSSCETGTFQLSKAKDNFAPNTCVPLNQAKSSNSAKTFTTTSVQPLEDEVKYKIRITGDVEEPGGIKIKAPFTQEKPFQIRDTTPPSISSTSPADGEVGVPSNATLTIQFSEDMDVGSLSNLQTQSGNCRGAIQLSENQFSSCLPFKNSVPVVSSGASVFSVRPKSLMKTTTLYQLKVTKAAKDESGHQLPEDWRGIFETFGDLRITETSPPDSLNPLVPRGSIISISFNRELNREKILFKTTSASGCPGNIMVSLDGFSDCVAMKDELIFSNNGKILKLTPQGPLENFSVYKIRVLKSIEDIYSVSLKEDQTQVQGFKTQDTIPPTISQVSPVDGSVIIPRDTNITVSFDKDMDPNSITTNTNDDTCSKSLQVSKDNFSTCVQMASAPVGSQGNSVWTMTPLNKLDNFEIYKTRVKTSVTDGRGNHLQNEYTQALGFQTIDDVPPTVISTAPVDGFIGAPVDTSIVVTFSEPMDLTSITVPGTSICGTFSLQVKVGPNFTECLPISRTQIDNNGSQFTMIPTNSLIDDGRSYQIFVTSRVKDPQGNNMEQDFRSVFRSIDLVPPSVVLTSPITSSTQNINEPLGLTFSEDVDTLTLITNQAGDTSCTNKTWKASVDGFNTCIPMQSFQTIDNKAFSLSPHGDIWPRQENISVEISSGILDLQGNALATPTMYNFYTNNPGRAQMTTPVDGDNEVLLNSKIILNFDRVMDENTMTVNDLSSDCQGNIQLSRDNFSTQTNCLSFSQSLPVSLGSSNYEFTPTGLDFSSSYSLRVFSSVLTSSTPTGWPLNQDFTFTTITPPTVESVSPLDQTLKVPRNTSVVVTFSKTMDVGTLTSNTADSTCSGSLKLSEDSNFSNCVQIAAAPVASNASKTFTIQPSSNLANFTDFYFQVTMDNLDTKGQSLSQNFNTSFKTIDDILPEVIGPLVPASAATDVLVNTSISATFNKAMNESSFSITDTDSACTSAIKIQVSKDDFANCLATENLSFSSNKTVVSLSPKVYLDGVSEIKVKILSGVKGLNENQMSSDYIWSFQTGSVPAISSIDPLDNQEYVELDTSISVNFNMDMDSTSIVPDDNTSCSQGNVFLSSSSNFVAGTCIPLIGVTYPATNQVVFSSGQNLQEDQSYYFKVGESVRSISGLLLGEDFFSSFTTKNTIPPNLILPTIPADGETGVQEINPIQLRFDDVMKNVTITTNSGTATCTGNIMVSKDNFSTCFPLGTPSSTDNRSFSINPGATFDSEETYFLKILGPNGVEDFSGNKMNSDYLQNNGFTIRDYINPTIVSALPAQAESTNTGPTFVITFDEAMDRNTLNTKANIYNTDCPSTMGLLVSENSSFTSCLSMKGTLPTTYDNRSYIYELGVGLEKNRTYYYRVTTNAKDLSGNPLANNYNISFNTSFADDNVPVLLSPIPNSATVTYIKNDINLKVGFEKEVVPSSVTNNSNTGGCDGTIMLSRLNDNFSNCVVFSSLVTPESSSNTSFFLSAPVSDLDTSTDYILKVAKEIQNTSGTLNLRGDYYFQFRTLGRPRVLELRPADQIQDFPVKGTFEVVFDTPMDASSLVGSAGACSGGFAVSNNGFYSCVDLNITDRGDNKGFQLTPKENLPRGAVYNFKVSKKARSIYGIFMEKDFPNDIGNTLMVDPTPRLIDYSPNYEDRGEIMRYEVKFRLDFDTEMYKPSFTYVTGSDVNGNQCSGSVQLKYQDGSNKCIGPLTMSTTDNKTHYFESSFDRWMGHEIFFQLILKTDIQSANREPLGQEYRFQVKVTQYRRSSEVQNFCKEDQLPKSGREVTLNWKKSKEHLVNSLGGGYILILDNNKENYCKKIHFDGKSTAHQFKLNLPSGKWNVKVKAFSRLNKEGSSFSEPLMIDVP